MTKLQMTIAQMMAANPEMSDAEIARQLGCSAPNICAMKKKPGFQEYLQHCLDEQWKEYGKKARKQMAQLADNGDYRAIEFLLKTNGLNPAQIIEADVNNVVVNITDDPQS